MLDLMQPGDAGGGPWGLGGQARLDEAGGQGARTQPSDIWKSTMDGALEDTDNETFPKPEEIGGYAGVPQAPAPPPSPPPGGPPASETVIQPTIELAPGVTIPWGPPPTVPAAPPVPVPAGPVPADVPQDLCPPDLRPAHPKYRGRQAPLPPP